MKPILLIVEREFMSRVKKRSFILTTLLTPLLIAVSVFFSVWISSAKDTETQTIDVVDCTGLIAGRLKGADHIIFRPMPVVPFDSIQSQAVHASGDFIIFYIAGNQNELPTDFILYANRQVNADVRDYVERSVNDIIEDYKLQQYEVAGLDQILREIQTSIDLRTIKLDKDGSTTETNSYVLMGISYIAAMAIYFFIFLFGSMVMRGVIEEKSNRIIEVLISSVKPFDLMLGKIIGIASVGLLQFILWVALTFGFVMLAQLFLSDPGSLQAAQEASSFGGQVGPQMSEVQGDVVQKILLTMSGINLPFILLAFLLYFLGGYLMYASMFAAIGSAVESEAETQQLILPVTIPLVIGVMMMVHTFQYPNSSMSFWASMVPFTSPMVMMARIPFGVPSWQIVLSISLLVGTFILFTFLAGKIYRVGILMYGKKPSLKELWRWMHYKR